MTTEYCQVVTATGNRDDALALARSAVDARLAACAQVSGPIESVYRWQGSIAQEPEWKVTLKTSRERYTALEQHIRERHTYEVPEILCLPVLAGNPDYLQWVDDNLC